MRERLATARTRMSLRSIRATIGVWAVCPSRPLANALERAPLARRQQLRAGVGTILLGHVGKTVLGQGMVGEDRDGLVALGAGHPQQELSHRLRRAAEPVHDLDREHVGALLG